MARDRSISVTLKAQVDGYLAGMQRASAATKDFATQTKSSAESHKADWEKVGRTLTVAGLVVAAGVGLAISRFADFDQAMSAAGAASNATAGDLAKLREAALQAGQDTQYSAVEAANGITELAKAGVSVKDILGGGLKGALDLAAAGQMEVGKAAELAAISMKQFKLTGDQLPHVADLLAAGAGKAVGSVEDLGMALKQSGQVAAGTGLTIDETTGALSAFASAGLIGSDAGTSFKSMLQRLTPQSAEARAEMQRLGISAYDAQGNFVGLEKFAGNLQTALSGLTAEQRNSAMATIFGSDAVRAAAVLYDEGADGIHKWVASVNDAGFAQRQAARLTDNWRGDIERLGGALDTALIQGGSGANSALRSLTQTAEGAIAAFSGLPPSLQSATVYAGAATAAVLLLGGAALSTVPKVLALKASLDAVSIAGVKGTTVLKSLAVAGATVAAISVGGSVMEQQWLKASGAADDATRSLDAFLRAGGDAQGVTAQMKWGFQDLGGVVNQVFNGSIWHGALAAVGELGTGFGIFGTTQTDDAIEFFREMDTALAGFVSNGRADDAAKVFQDIAAQAQKQGVSIDQVKAALPQYAAALDGVTTSGEATATGQHAATDAINEYLQATRGAKDATDAYVAALKGLASPLLDASAAAQGWEAAIDDADAALKKNGATLDITNEKGRANKKALDDMARAAIENVAAMAANGASQGQLQGTLDASRQKLEDTAVRFGMSREQARQYADQLLKVPPVVTTIVNANTATAYRQILDYANAVASLPAERTTIIRTVTIAQHLDAVADSRGLAEGGIFTNGIRQMAEGGLSRQAMIMRSQAPILWNEAPGGEAYIPLAADKRARSLAIWTQVGRMLGATMFADGGLVARAMASAAPPATLAPAGHSFTVGQVVAADPKAAVRELNVRWRDAMAAQGLG